MFEFPPPPKEESKIQKKIKEYVTALLSYRQNILQSWLATATYYGRTYASLIEQEEFGLCEINYSNNSKQIESYIVFKKPKLRDIQPGDIVGEDPFPVIAMLSVLINPKSFISNEHN